MRVHRTQITDDLAAICAQIQPDLWGKDNEMTAYDLELLKQFLEAGNILLLVYEGDKITGVATAHKLLHPSKGGSSLYVHELDTHPEYRRLGVGTMLMEELFKIASEEGLDEVWVGADEGNDAAHGLYKSLNPYEADPSTIYAYKTGK